MGRLPIHDGHYGTGLYLAVHNKKPTCDLSIWDTGVHAFREVAGQFAVKVGASSRDLRLEATLSN